MALPAVPPATELKLDLSGDRAIEWSWVAANIPEGPGYALDFGPGSSQLSTLAAMKGYDVTAVDMLDQERPFLLPNIRFLKGDLLELPLEKGHFDLIINCSTVEHTGISGRYGIEREDADADLKAMQLLLDLMRPNGIQLLTIPVGVDAVWRPLHRVYGLDRLPRLLSGYRIVHVGTWVKDRYNCWTKCRLEFALKQPTSPQIYSIGAFILQRNDHPAPGEEMSLPW